MKTQEQLNAELHKSIRDLNLSFREQQIMWTLKNYVDDKFELLLPNLTVKKEEPKNQ